MENKVLDKNLASLANYDKDLSDKILMTDIEKSNLQLAQNPNGEYNLILDDTPLYSNDIQKELQDIVKSNPDDPNSIKIIYGLGLGYLPDIISNNCEKSSIIIYENNLELLKFVLSIAQIDALYKKNVVLCSSKEKLREHINNSANENSDLSICFINSYKNLFYDDILSLFQEAQNVLSEIIGNKNTYIKNMPFACNSTLINLKKIIKNADITSLRDIYQDKTALIMCAGPSLEENIEIIKNNTKNCVTFALNPALKLLKKYNITPDFVVDIDIVDNLKQFDSIDLSNSYFITDAYTHHKIVNLPSKKHFFYISENNFFNCWIRKNLDINNELQTLGTASYTAFQSALLMGFKKIILIGQDLSFKNGNCYSKESQYDVLKCEFNKEKQKYEIIAPDFEAFKNAYKKPDMPESFVQYGAKRFLNNLNSTIRTVKDVSGNLVPTKADYLTFIRIFEKAAENIKNVELINSSMGADIKGFKNIKLEDALFGLPPVEKLELGKYKSHYNLEKFKKEVDILYNNLDKV